MFTFGFVCSRMVSDIGVMVLVGSHQSQNTLALPRRRLILLAFILSRLVTVYRGRIHSIDAKKFRAHA